MKSVLGCASLLGSHISLGFDDQNLYSTVATDRPGGMYNVSSRVNSAKLATRHEIQIYYYSNVRIISQFSCLVADSYMYLLRIAKVALKHLIQQHRLMILTKFAFIHQWNKAQCMLS